MADDNQALLLQLSADISKLEKAFKKASGVVDGESGKMEARAKRMGKKLEADVGKIDVTQSKSGIQSLVDLLGKKLGGAADTVSGQAGGLTAGLGELGIAGAAAGVAIGALTFAIGEAQKAMSWADDLAQVADNLGITSEELQKLNYVAKRSNIDNATLTSGLAALNSSLGAIKTGVGDAKLKKAFEAIGIKPDQIRSMKDASQLLPLLAEKLRGLDKASQIRIADKLGIGPLLPILTEANGKISDLSDEAERLGMVIDNKTVNALADMNNQVEIASERIDTQLKKAFVSLAPVIEGAVTKFADFLQLLTTKVPNGEGTVGGLLLRLGAGDYMGAAKQVASKSVDQWWLRNNDLKDAHAAGLYGDKANSYADAAASRRASDAGRHHAPYAKLSEDVVKTPEQIALDKRIAALSGGGGGRSKAGASSNDPLAGTKSDLASVMNSLATPDEKADAEYLDRVQKLDAAMKAGLITAKQYNDEVSRAQVDRNGSQGITAKLPELGAMADKDIGPVIDHVAEQSHHLRDAVGEIGNAFEDAFSRAGGSMKDFGAIFAQELEQMAIEWAASKLTSAIFGSADDNGNRSGGFLSHVFGHNAMGTDNWRGGPTWVGERGPEIVNLPRGAQVIPNHRVQSFAPVAAGGGGAMNIILHSTYEIAGAVHPSEISQAIERSHGNAVQRAVSEVRKNFGSMSTSYGKMGR